MGTRNVYEQVQELLQEYLRPLGMTVNAGPRRAMGDLVQGIIFTGSVQISNAARRLVGSGGALSYHVKRLSLALSERSWNHNPWAQGILARQAAAVGEQDLLALDATELAKPYARHLEHQCIVKDASRPGDPLVAGYWCYGAYRYVPDPERVGQAQLSPVLLVPYSQEMPGFL